MKNPIYLINKRFSSLRPSEKRVAEYIQKNMDEVILSSLQKVANKCNTSDATVLRFCKAIGYLGFDDFKVSLVPELLKVGSANYNQLEPKQNGNGIHESLQKNFLKQMYSLLLNSDQKIIVKVASHISRANKILVIGLGGSAGGAHIFCDSLGSLGILSFCLQDRSIMQNAVPTLNSEDVIVGISHSGETLEIVSAVKSAKEYGAHTICITNYSPSSLADVTQLPLITGVPSNLLGSYSCQARISQLVILELILHELSKLVEKRDDNHLLNSQSENKQTNKKTNIQKKELTL